MKRERKLNLMPRKKVAIVILAIMLMLCMIVMAGCAGGNHADGLENMFDKSQIDHNLVGEWVWDLDREYTYIFNDDGTGMRSVTPGTLELFEWSVPESGHLLVHSTTGRALQFDIELESWSYRITGDSFIVNSRQSDLMFHYIRASAYVEEEAKEVYVAQPQTAPSPLPAPLPPAAPTGNYALVGWWAANSPSGSGWVNNGIEWELLTDGTWIRTTADGSRTYGRWTMDGRGTLTITAANLGWTNNTRAHTVYWADWDRVYLTIGGGSPDIMLSW